MHHEIDYLLLPSDERKRKRRRREKKKACHERYAECSFSLSNYVSLLYLPFIFFSSLSSCVCWWSNVCLDR
jgi:hypothetical protein